MTTAVAISDLFVEDVMGGAELTLEAILSSAPSSVKVGRLRAQDATLETVKLLGPSVDLWIIGNAALAPRDALVEITHQDNTKMVMLECDYRFCKYRSLQMHEMQEGKPCDCMTTDLGKLAAGLYKRSFKTFFMSEGQLGVYKQHIPAMQKWDHMLVQGSTWTPKQLANLQELGDNRDKVGHNDKWAVLGGGTWIKNQDAIEEMLVSRKTPYDVIGGGIPHDEFMKQLSRYKGLVFHPAGHDTCPRIVIEAALMGLELDLNKYVQHIQDDWWLDTYVDGHGDRKAMDAHLRDRGKWFWEMVL